MKRSTKWAAEGEDKGFMKTFVRAVVLVAVLGGTFSFGMRPAWACSCAPLDAKQTLRETDGAFVGELVARKDPAGFPRGGLDTSVFTFRVTESFKGDVGERVQVESASDGAACGLEVTQGERVGLFLTNEQNQWTSNLCHQVEAGVLERAAKSTGVGEAASAPEEPRTDAAPSASVRRQERSPVWPLVLVAAAAAAGVAITIFFVRARRSSAR